jgi:hypothetical protein
MKSVPEVEVTRRESRSVRARQVVSVTGLDLRQDCHPCDVVANLAAVGAARVVRPPHREFTAPGELLSPLMGDPQSAGSSAR